MRTVENVYSLPHQPYQVHIYFQFTHQEGGFICIVPGIIIHILVVPLM